MNNLKPCPFCGSENIVVTNWGLWRCWCQECLAKTNDELKEVEAIEAWNRRAEPVKEQDSPDVVEVVRCKYCKDNLTGRVHEGTIWCERYHARRPLNGFCNYGERKEGENNA